MRVQIVQLGDGRFTARKQAGFCWRYLTTREADQLMLLTYETEAEAEAEARRTWSPSTGETVVKEFQL